MYRIFQRFAEQLTDSRDAEGFRLAMAEAARGFDLPCFAYLVMPTAPGCAAGLLSTYPAAWTQHYLNAHYERLDPVIARAQMQPEPFEWGLQAESERLSPAQEQLLDEAATFGIRCGFTVPICTGRAPVAAVTFASDAPRQSFIATINANRRVLQLMAISLHAHLTRKLVFEPRLGGVRLTPRELECLRWIAQGKSAADTAEIIQISRRTVVFHLENAKRKLGVRTLYQAVAKLSKLGAQ